MILTCEQWAASVRRMKGEIRPCPEFYTTEPAGPLYVTSLSGRAIIVEHLARGACERLAMASCERDHMTYQRCIKVLHQVRNDELDPETGAEYMRRILTFPLPSLDAIVKVEGRSFRSYTVLKPQYTNHTEHQSVTDPDTGIAVFVFTITEGADLADAPEGDAFVFGPTHKVVANVDGGYFGMWWAYKHAEHGGIHKWDKHWNSEADAVAAVALIIKEEQAEKAEGSA